MKLSWLNTSEAHTNKPSIYMIWKYDAKLKIIKRELESMDQSLTHGYVSRFEPLLYVPAFTQKDFQSTNLSTQDSHTRNLH